MQHFTEGIFDFPRIGGEIEGFAYRLYSFPIPGDEHGGIEGRLKKVRQTRCNFCGLLIWSMGYTCYIWFRLRTPC